MGKMAINIQPVPAPTQNITPVINPTVKTGAEALQLLDSVDMTDYTRLASGLFPSGATGKIAKALLDLAPDITTDFSQVRIQSQSRTALQRDKFSLSPEEAWKTLGKVSVLSDSLFVRHA